MNAQIDPATLIALLLATLAADGANAPAVAGLAVVSTLMSLGALPLILAALF
tara:strand:+ start:66 stop:221 length:156 start_codon:yes stop_codon:yes gene_type:complete